MTNTEVSSVDRPSVLLQQSTYLNKSTSVPGSPLSRKPVNRDALNELDDRRIEKVKPLIPPQILDEELPMTEEAFAAISRGRKEAEDVIAGRDDRLLVVVGPCSIHDPKAALEYADKLQKYAIEASEDLVIIMRCYFEKPRTTVGWKGLINDPFYENSFKINTGLRMARELLLNINEIGLPCAVEFLDTITPQFIGDLVSWGAIGARTTESQVHRELASGLSAPVGFKNGTDGNVQIAIDALKAAREPHHFLSVTKQGLSAIICTTGNDSCHVILRGGNAGPNYKAEFVVPILEKLKAAGVNERIMIDCSHGNSEKDHRKQRLVAEDIITQLPEEHGIKIAGVMIESNLVEGKQNVSDAHTEKGLVYGQSVTDACINWEDTVVILNKLREGVRSRRLASSKQ